MLRMLVVASALGFPAITAAEEFPLSALHTEVVSDTGEVVGRVESVERNGRGEIVAVTIPSLEPPSAVPQPDQLIAERERAQRLLVSQERRERGAVTTTRAR